MNATTQEHPQNHGDTPVKLLVVDDEEYIRRVLQRLLMRLPQPPPVSVETADSAESALDMLESNEYDLVFTDFNMGGKDGIHLLSQVSEKHPQTLRLLMTGYTDDDIESQARNKGKVHSFVRKPWNSRELLDLINALLKSSPGTSAAGDE